MPRRNHRPRRKRTATDPQADRPTSLAAMAEALVERGLASSAILGGRPLHHHRPTNPHEESNHE